jgi:predicted RNase H-like HicB family nuclease
MKSYPIFIEPLSEDEGGGFIASFPDLPGCMSDGETELEAVENALDAFKAWMTVQQERGVHIPEPMDAQQEFTAAAEATEAEIQKLKDALSAANEKFRRTDRAKFAWAFKREAGKFSIRARA